MSEKKHRLMFLHIPKTAGTSIRTVLIQSGCRYGPCSPESPWEPRHESALMMRERVGNRAFYQAIKLAVVRNPYDRIVSHYSAKYPENHRISQFKTAGFLEGFSQYAHRMADRRPFLKSQWSRLAIGGNLATQRLLRFENLAEEWPKFAEEFGLPIELPKINANEGRRSWQEFYTEELDDIIYGIYRLDFERFGYPRWRDGS